MANTVPSTMVFRIGMASRLSRNASRTNYRSFSTSHYHSHAFFNARRAHKGQKPARSTPVFLLFSALGLAGCIGTFSSANIQNNASTHGHDFINNDTIPLVQQTELSLHNKPDDCWVSIHGHVYDVTEFLEAHPGGADKLLRFAGKDATRSFRLQHPEGHLERYLGEEAYRGELIVPAKEKKKKNGKGKASREEKMKEDFEKETVKKNHIPRPASNEDDIDKISKYYLSIVDKNLKKEKGTKDFKKKQTVERVFNAEDKPSLDQIFSTNDFEYVAKKVLPDLVYTYLQTGSDNEFSRYEDRAALCRIFFRPKCLVDVSELQMNSKVLGINAEVPFLVGAFPGSGLIQEEGETLVVKSASERNVLQIIPKDSDSSVEEIMKEAKGRDIFYQYSIDNKEELANGASVLNELKKKYPNIRGFFIDVENSNSGNLEHYKKVEAGKHQTEENPAPQLQVGAARSNFKLCWSDLQKLKNEVNVPIVLKGVQRSEDILRSRELGFHGVMISNHEGKQLDQNQSAIEILYDARRKLQDGNADFDIFVEGGFRRGSDIVKALCLGGKPVVSKPVLFSEIYGEAGVKKGIDILNKEIATTMRLIGARSVSELGEEFIDCTSLQFKMTAVRNLDAMYDANYTPMPPPPFQNQDKLKMV